MSTEAHPPHNSNDPPEPTLNSSDSASENAETASASSSEDESDDEEPRLKYTRLTKSLGSVHRNGDAVSATLVFGERMVSELLKLSGASPGLN